uniref:histone-lysine N-methyltransferase SETDB1-B-like n=1 Tax=Scatophagus argus TaxID=75038 RepID=UPI001ED7F4B6|nr:histone-lysine N-methyltransferase SETDB1-B-like [Scatophagus argus]XP_046273293.1 histone-lysine N-methyltransferase SETDB1-B-like [Scatophagus argus]
MEVDEVATVTSGESGENNGKVESDEDENIFGSSRASVPPTNEIPSKKTKLEDSSDVLSSIKNAVVVLTRLPEYKISALRPPTPQQFYSEDESLSSSDSDTQWKPEGHSSDSDCPLSNYKRKTGKPRTPAAQTSRNNNNVSELAPVIVSSAFSHYSNETTKIRPDLPEEEVKVDMMVLAKKKSLKWQRGKILEIVTREDGRLKYKVSFEERGKSLVSGHHIAFDTPAKLEQLYVGARVVVSCQDNKSQFQPGILAELPTRKNRSRFLVFLDDHMPVYVGLPSLHLVCRPLENVLDDMPHSTHKSFMRKYLKDWPYPHLTQYSVGQSLNAELHGVQQRCEVLVIDSSLMQVAFQGTPQKEWIHRGSIRLEHMARFLELTQMEEDECDSD